MEEEKGLNTRCQQGIEEHTAPFEEFRTTEAKEGAEKAMDIVVPKVDNLVVRDEVADTANVPANESDPRDVKKEVHEVSILPQVATDDSKSQENIREKILPAFLAPILDLLLDAPPLYESSHSFRFGTFPGVQAVVKQKRVRITEKAAVNPTAATPEEKTDAVPLMDSSRENEQQYVMAKDAQSAEVIPEAQESQEIGDEAIRASVSMPISLNEQEPEHGAEQISMDSVTYTASHLVLKQVVLAILIFSSCVLIKTCAMKQMTRPILLQVKCIHTALQKKPH